MRHIDTLKNNESFQRVFRVHDSVADRNLILYRAPGTGKLGIVCTKKIGNSVIRHRFQRVVREAFRLNRNDFRNDIDIVVIARENAKGQGLTEIERSFLNLVKRPTVF
ncbi:MAG: ribonuclease P protein component [Lachnospiraceae bacterium]|nr:ribonuclease P protein component [Lachnospiraceae bacterium]